MPRDKTGNSRYRPPLCAVTREMADAGLEKLNTLVGIDLDQGVTDEQLVCEVFQAMWSTYWTQVDKLHGKGLKVPGLIALPPQGLIRQ